MESLSKVSKEIKQESSIPVQSRVSFMSLARLHRYWVDEGYSIRTMSQLVSWSVDLLCEVLEANEKMPGDIDTLAKAHQYLQVHGLYQGSTKKIAMKKISTALRFEALREHGINPESHIPLQHKMLHRENSVRPLDCLVDAGKGTSNSEWDEIQRRIKEEDEKDARIAKEKAMKSAKEAGLVVSEPELEEPEMLSQEEARAKYFKEQARLKALKEGTIEEVKHSNVIGESEPSVKEGMSEEEYEVKMEEIKQRDEVRLELENAPFDVSDLPIVDDE
jgi:hypothetical protein